MRGSYSEITEAGADVVAIGTGDARYARDFIEQEDIPYLVLLDDEAAAAKAASIARGSTTDLLGPRNWMGGVRATVRGHRQRKTGKRPAQLGATFVVAQGGGVIFEHRSSEPADNPDVDAVVEAVRALT